MQLQNIENFYPLSPLQEGLLFHSMIDPDSNMYFSQVVVPLEGRIDISAFERAWQYMLDRYSILRTFFVWEGVKFPVQVVEQQAKLPFVVHDWRAESQHDSESRIASLRQSEMERGFDLSKAPLLRLALILLSDDKHAFIWSFHHILMDGWSMFTIFKEVFALYDAFCNGRELHLKPTRPYRDFIAWIKQQDRAKAEIFWRKTLKGVTAPTPLVVDKLSSSKNGATGKWGLSPHQAAEFDAQSLRLPEEITNALKSMSKKYRLTLNTIIQAAWAFLMSRYCGETDVVFGAVVSGRPADLSEVDSMVGLFINTLPMRVHVCDDDSLIHWLQKIQALQAEMREYEYSSLVDVQGWSEVPRGQPFFESFFLFENYRKEVSFEDMAHSLGIGKVRWFERTNYPLMVLAVPEKQLLLRITYQSNRFDAATITRMLGHWRTLLEGMVADPDCRLADLPLLTREERQQLLVAWNDTKTDISEKICLADLFEAQVERTPDAVAVAFAERQLTYRELNRRANQLAHKLKQLGVAPEVLVGICTERSLEMIVGLLGILKAGGAYIPLDPAYPKDRIDFMLRDANVPVLLTQKSLLDEIPRHGAQILCLDRDWEIIARESVANLESAATAENLAYVIYTSGSTGKPKGVAIPHHALVNFLGSMRKQPGLYEDDVLLSVTTLSFDIAGLELYLPLMTGARVELADREVTVDGLRLSEKLETCGATVMQATPATWRMLLETGWAGNKQLKILCGGEALPRDLAEKLQKRAASLWNMYGPTETTIWSTTLHVQPGNGAVPIGRPVDNTPIFIVASSWQPSPIGVHGDLYIGGDGLARGYLNRPELTAERFVPDPYCGFRNAEFGVMIPKSEFQNPKSTLGHGARIYNTGDLAKYRPDGNIEFLGRNDQQVKIRGFRIELGEIEAMLAQYPGVKQNVVHATNDGLGSASISPEAGQRLIAYLIADEGEKLAIEDLRGFLLEKLPDYMIPSAFVVLDRFPLTPNGKVDRRKLPAPDGIRQNLKTAYVAPRSEIERNIAAIWRQALHLEKVGLHDNFFDLGGHSLLMTQVYSKIRKAFDKDLPMVELFRFPTVSSMARYLSREQHQEPALQQSQDRAERRKAAMQRRRKIA